MIRFSWALAVIATALAIAGCRSPALRTTDDSDGGLGCTDEVWPAPPKPAPNDGRRTNYDLPLATKRCSIEVEVFQATIECLEMFGCPQPRAAVSTELLDAILAGPTPLELLHSGVWIASTDGDPSTFFSPGNRPAELRVITSRSYQFGPDESGREGGIGGAGVCVVGLYETVVAVLRDVDAKLAEANPFQAYTYRELETRPATECDSIIDSYR